MGRSAPNYHHLLYFWMSRSMGASRRRARRQSGLYQDLVEVGVVDPTKVVRVALQNAASVASLMLTTEALIAERPKHGTNHE